MLITGFYLSSFFSAAEHVSSVVLGALGAALVLVGARASPSAPQQELQKALGVWLGEGTSGATSCDLQVSSLRAADLHRNSHNSCTLMVGRLVALKVSSAEVQTCLYMMTLVKKNRIFSWKTPSQVNQNIMVSLAK